MLPNCLIIGAPRCGTDYLFYNLSNHKEISAAKNREAHFFDNNFYKGLSWYEELFIQENKIILEKTANYFVCDVAAERIKNTLENVKLIVSLRNPIDRAYSFYKNWIGLRVCSYDLSFMDCVKKYPRILTDGNYYEHLKRYLNYFRLEDIFVLFFEDLLADPYKIFSDIFNFLKIENDNSFITLNKKNESKKLFSIRGHVLSDIEILILKKIFGKQKANRMLKKFEYDVPALSNEDRKYLYDYYYESNNKLFKLIGVEKDWN